MLNINIEKIQKIIMEVADAEIMPRYNKLCDGDVEYKNPGDPVTIADKEAEKALSNRLSGLLQGSKVVGEEEFATDSGVLKRIFCESPVWIIDPIDGTRAFMAGKPQFGVIVALAERNQTVAGWLYDPTSREFVTAEKGAGAYYKGEKLKISSVDMSSDMIGALGHTILKAYREAGKPAVPNGLRFEGLGFACHDYARLVVQVPHFAGKKKGDIHFRASQTFCTPWDDAAGVLIHQEAGGYSAHWDETPFLPSSYNKGLLVAPDRESWLRIRDWIKSFCDLGNQKSQT